MIKKGGKLKNDRGASIIMALVVVLVLTMVSVVIISSAYTNMARLKRNQAEQQAYLTVSSAAQLMRDSIAGASYSSSSTTPPEGSGEQPTSSTTPAEGAFAGMLNAIAAGNNPSAFTISAAGLDDVSVTVKKDASGCGFSAVLCLAGSPQSNSYIDLKCKADSKTQTTVADDGSTTVTATTVWGTADITKGEGG